MSTKRDVAKVDAHERIGRQAVTLCFYGFTALFDVKASWSWKLLPPGLPWLYS